MTLRMLCLFLVLGCAAGRAHDPARDGRADSERVVDEQGGGCEWRGTVTVHVENRSSADVQISFGPYTPARAAPGLSRTTYRVPREYLRSDIRLATVRGGLDVGTPPPVATEPVVCSDATLIIGSHIRYSFFYGAVLESPGDAAASECCTATIRALVPEGTGTVYLAGHLPELGPWRPDGLAMAGEGRERIAQISAPPGTALEYKFTLGSWDREALGPAGTVPPNHRLLIDGDIEIAHEITGFKRDLEEYIADWEGSGVVGRLVYWTDVASVYLAPTRHVEIWLPPGYDDAPATRYPVLYMHDGQNLFDPRIAYAGVDWGVDEAVVRLARSGTISSVIVVGVWSTAERGLEYSPWQHAADYARFLVDELMPRVNEGFRTLTGPEHTAVMGSSMGGLLSFYLVTQYPGVFGACGCISSHFPLSEAMVVEHYAGVVAAESPDTVPYIIRDIDAGLSLPRGVRYWFDYGTKGLDTDYGPTHEAVRTWLLRQGFIEGEDFVIRRYDGADHNEASWRARIDDPLMFLFGR